MQARPLKTPSRTGIHDLAPAPDGGVWFTAQRSRDKAWVSDFGANAVLRFDPNTEKFDASFPAPREAANVRQILGWPGEVWLPESGTEHIAVIRTA